ncbi:hypothetical protein BBP40_002008 [Aspergillus hancockii]|nr:hypothetical protein BBP40_002008 [Aspergillus hancockii]
MTVPYGDPCSPYHRKQAFDLSDSGFGITSNTLTLGCDCLGHIAYSDGIRTSGSGEPVVMKNDICMHEVDDSISWKHTDIRNRQAFMVRNQLVIQCTATVMNYEYIVTFVLDQAANSHIDVKATGIVSTIPIRQKTLSQLEPFGCALAVHTTPITQPGGYDLDLTKSRTYRIIHPSRINSVSGKPVGYKLHALPSQKLIMGPETFSHKCDLFPTKPIWVTSYQAGELWPAGEFTSQSRVDTGLDVWTQRNENIENEDVVLWHTFGVTHITPPDGNFPIAALMYTLMLLLIYTTTRLPSNAG